MCVPGHGKEDQLLTAESPRPQTAVETEILHLINVTLDTAVRDHL